MTLEMPEGSAPQEGFQLLGPEGVGGAEGGFARLAGAPG